jgi:hypothetical protein
MPPEILTELQDCIQKNPLPDSVKTRILTLFLADRYFLSRGWTHHRPRSKCHKKIGIMIECSRALSEAARYEFWRANENRLFGPHPGNVKKVLRKIERLIQSFDVTSTFFRSRLMVMKFRVMTTPTTDPFYSDVFIPKLPERFYHPDVGGDLNFVLRKTADYPASDRQFLVQGCLQAIPSLAVKNSDTMLISIHDYISRLPQENRQGPIRELMMLHRRNMERVMIQSGMICETLSNAPSPDNRFFLEQLKRDMDTHVSKMMTILQPLNQ